MQHVERKQGVVDAAELVPHDEQDRKIDLPHEVEHGFAVIQRHVNPARTFDQQKRPVRRLPLQLFP